MKSTHQRFLGAYLFIGIVQVCTEVFALGDSPIYYIAKPSILIALIIYFWNHSEQFQASQRRLFLLALVFAWLGDVLLMFQRQNALFFLLGLGSFFVMQGLYIQHFKTKMISFKWLVIILFLLFSVGMLSVVLPKLDSELKGPVMAYILAITLMGIMAYQRRGGVPTQSFQMVLVGAILFMISDSCIALNKFVVPSEVIQFLIMPTYIAAQYLIVRGVLNENSSTSTNLS